MAIFVIIACMRWRYNDKPKRIYPRHLAKFDGNSTWIAQAKLDGWSIYIIKDRYRTAINRLPESDKLSDVGEGLFFLSRRSIDSGGPTQLPVSQDIIEQVKSFELPDLSMIHGEWMKRRSIGECPERVYIHDILWLDDEWKGQLPYYQRDELLRSLIQVEGSVLFPDQESDGHFNDFFERQTKIPFSEGLVLKNRQHKISGNRKESKKSAMMLKCKYRDGDDGREIYVPPKR